MAQSHRKKIPKMVALAAFALWLIAELLDYKSSIEDARQAAMALSMTGPGVVLAAFWLFLPLVRTLLFAAAAYGVTYIVVYMITYQRSEQH